MSYRYMRLLVLFDLPVTTTEERREYTKFRKYLIKSGFMMFQESVYCRMALNRTAARLISDGIKRNSPPAGIVSLLCITEKQFADMEYITGEFVSDVIDSDERLVIFMTFAYSQIELYVDSEDKVLTLIIEHPDFFYTVLNDINDQIEGGTGFSVISCNAKLISFAKQATMITEFVPFEMNRKELISKLYAHLKKCSVNEDMFIRTNEMLSATERYISELAQYAEGEFVTDEICDVTPLLKMFGLKFVDSYDTLEEKLLEFFLAMTEYAGKTVFICVNLRSCLSLQKAEKLFESVIEHGIPLLCIESSDKGKTRFEKRVVIDDDLCVI